MYLTTITGLRDIETFYSGFLKTLKIDNNLAFDFMKIERGLKSCSVGNKKSLLMNSDDEDKRPDEEYK
jgi:hypothetical protein